MTCSSADLLPLSEWVRFLQQNEHASHDSVIRLASETIDVVLQSRLLPLYVMRAMAHAKKGQFDKAFRDGEEVIRLDPWSVQGYTCMAELHMLHGKAASAVHILKEGLSKVPGQDPAYYQLKLRLQEATEQMERHVDFITKLPTEILNMILGSPRIDQLIVLLHVSKAWRTRLLGLSKPWAAIRADGLSALQAYQLSFLIPMIGNHIEWMSLSVHHEKLRKNLITEASQGQLCKLKTLALRYCKSERIHMRTLLDAILRDESKLVNLHLTTESTNQEMEPPLLFGVLERYPNLETLGVSFPRMIIRKQMMMESPVASHKLTSLYLRCFALDIPAMDLVLRQCTNLRLLCICAMVLGSVTEDQIFDSIHRYSKQLEALDLDGHKVLYKLSEKVDKANKGLRFLRVRSTTRLEPLVTLLSEHHTTLEELDLPLHEHANPNMNRNKRLLSALHGLTFPSLRYLNISVISGTEDAISGMIRQCSKLESLLINFSEDILAFHILVTIATIPRYHLHHVRFLEIQGLPQNVVDTGLRFLFDAFVSLGTNASLREISFYRLDIPRESDVLTLWASLPHIEWITLFDVNVSNHQTIDLVKVRRISSGIRNFLGFSIIDQSDGHFGLR
ncbi:hypothetical protein BJV82DRAFT_717036 [Fennellomyces sp. T-0311]|nr:hypothetical protein BJV82DRAFT_717036 [Fennellomyces sp. T-0311]